MHMSEKPTPSFEKDHKNEKYGRRKKTTAVALAVLAIPAALGISNGEDNPATATPSVEIGSGLTVENTDISTDTVIGEAVSVENTAEAPDSAMDMPSDVGPELPAPVPTQEAEPVVEATTEIGDSISIEAPESVPVTNIGEAASIEAPLEEPISDIAEAISVTAQEPETKVEIGEAYVPEDMQSNPAVAAPEAGPSEFGPVVIEGSEVGPSEVGPVVEASNSTPETNS